MARVFVTGGSGFVGRNLIRGLIAGGDEVIALARSPRARLVVEELGALAAHGELEDIDALCAGLSDCERLYHAAAKVTEWGDPAEFQRVNVEGTNNLLKAARTAGVKTFLHVSTESVLADGSPIVDADETRQPPAKPFPRYARSKAEAEAAVLAANGSALKTVVVRPRMIWGGDDSSLLPQIMAAVEDGRFMWMNGGHYLTSTCHIDNLVAGALLAADKGRGGEVYYLTDGEPVELRAFLTRLLGTRGMTPPDKSIPRWLAWRAAQLCDTLWDFFNIASAPPVTRFTVTIIGQTVTVNDRKARRELGYHNVISREAGLAALERPKP